MTQMERYRQAGGESQSEKAAPAPNHRDRDPWWEQMDKEPGPVEQGLGHLRAAQGRWLCWTFPRDPPCKTFPKEDVRSSQGGLPGGSSWPPEKKGEM